MPQVQFVGRRDICVAAKMFVLQIQVHSLRAKSIFLRWFVPEMTCQTLETYIILKLKHVSNKIFGFYSITVEIFNSKLQFNHI